MSFPINNFIYAAAALASGIVIACLPPRFLRKITAPFTMGHFGIRKIRRWHTTTDTLGNVLETLCVIFCIVYPLIPYYTVVFGVLTGFALLCVLARAAIISLKEKTGYRAFEIRTVICVLWTFGILGILAGTGVFNGQAMLGPIQSLVLYIRTQDLTDVMYYLRDPAVFYYLLQMGLMMIPLCMLWNQFKHMRLERTWKGTNLFTFLLKMIIVAFVLLWAGTSGFAFLNSVWHVKDTNV